ncbi:MAG: LacI family transcriptional regulator [Anaerolineae bacterium]|nr:LacI family transcriptional regulator [Anaerolineae bacterium]
MKKNSPQRITIKDIAHHAGVSKTAVSFAFNVPGRLSEETTQHILEVAQELGYTPNPIARSLNTRRTNAIGILVPQDIPDVLTNPFFPGLMAGIGQVCKQVGMSLMLVPPMRGSMVDATYAALVDGCIVTGLGADDEAVKALQKRNVPFVMIDTDAPAEIASVNIADCEGAQLGMGHLLNGGHRHIAIATFQSYTGKLEEYAGTLRQRVDGVRAALKAHKLSLKSEGIYIWECTCNAAGGHEIVSHILAQTPRPTAVFALADVIAHGIIEAAKLRGLRVPEDLAVVGFDDLETSSLISPALTTVRQPIAEKGRRAAEILMTMLQGDPCYDHVVLPVKLVVRESA